MDELISSLLIWHGSELIPASSAACDSSQRQTSDHNQTGVKAFEVSNDCPAKEHIPSSSITPINSSAASHPIGSHKRLKLCRHKEGYERDELTWSTSPASTAQASRWPKLSLHEAISFSSACTTMSLTPSSGQMAAHLHPGSMPNFRDHVADMDSAAYPEGQATDEQPLDLESIEDFDKRTVYQPPRPTVMPARSDSQFGDHASAFNNACQQRGLFPNFEYHEVAKACFNVTLKINNQIVDQIGPYASKKDAKNEICKRSMTKLDAFSNNKKRKQDDERIDSHSPPAGIGDEEWIGIIHNFLQTRKLGNPDFKLMSPHPTMGPWKCELSFAESPPTPFGLDLGPFRRKDEAKKAAAMEAVSWLRSQGKLPQGTFDRNLSKRTQQTPINSEGLVMEGPGGLADKQTQTLDAVSKSGNAGEPIGKHVHGLMVSLGFTQPEFRFIQRDGAFVDVWAIFSDRDVRYEPRLAGEVGRVDHVFGKKAAKEECWRELLKVLEGIERSRSLLT